MKKLFDNIIGFIGVFTFVIPVIPTALILFISYEIEVYRYHAFLQMMGWSEQRVGFWHWVFLFGGRH